MHTQRTIGLIALAILVAASAVLAGLVSAFGTWPALALATILVSIVVQLYRGVVRPWHLRWGATDDEATSTLPGDELLDATGQSTRAIGIDAPAGDVWPWLVQIGFGRAGWYSYDWIDNDGEPSADRIVAALQDLQVGDTIPMTPSIGFTVVGLDLGRSLVARGVDSTTWCLQLVPQDADRCRLVSRFRVRPVPSPTTTLLSILTDPGVFVMERRMLLGIKRRAETAVARAPAR